MIDWEAARLAYVSGRKTYAEIAAQFGVAKSSVSAHGKAEQWAAQRSAWRRSVANRAIRRKGEQEGERLARLMDSAEQLIGHLNRVTSDKDQFFRRIAPIPQKQDEEDPETEMVLPDFISRVADTKSLEQTTKALNELTKAVRNLYDLPTGEQKRAHNLAVRKLSIEEKKSHAGVDPEQYGIILIPESGKPDTDGAVEVEE